jgi:hypothetical protein
MIELPFFNVLSYHLLFPFVFKRHVYIWNPTLTNNFRIRDNFNPLDVSRILKIPFNENMDEDFIAWHITKAYSFLVWSAYWPGFSAKLFRKANSVPHNLVRVFFILITLFFGTAILLVLSLHLVMNDVSLFVVK